MSYIICFWDKSKLQVSTKTGERLKQGVKSGDIKNFELEGGLYSIAGIEKIITKGQAYETFPTEGEYLKELEDTASDEENKEWEKQMQLESSKSKQLI